MNKKICAVLAVVTAVIMILSGCGATLGSVIEKDPLLGGEGMEVIDAGKIGSDKKDYTKDGQEIIAAENTEAIIYLIIPSEENSTNEERNIISEGLADKCTLIVRNYARESSLQSEYFDEAIDLKASMIICDNGDYTNTADDCARAKDAGIPVVLLDMGLDIQGNADYQIVTDYYSTTKLIAGTFGQHVGGEADYIALYDEANDMGNAFKVGLKNYKDVHLIESVSCDGNDKSASYEAAWNLINDHGDATAIVCGTSTQALEALAAMADLGINMKVICLKGDDDRISSYVDQGQIFAAIIKPGEDIADSAVDVALAYVENRTLPSRETLYVQGLIKVFSITPESIEYEEGEDVEESSGDNCSEESYSSDAEQSGEDEYYNDEEYYDEEYYDSGYYDEGYYEDEE